MSPYPVRARPRHPGTTAVILAGGLGTRLRPSVADRPKCLAEIAGRPFLTYLLDQLVDAGIRSVILCTGHLAEQIETEIGTSHRSIAIQYSREHRPLGTGGALIQAMELVTTESILVLNGDSYCETDLGFFCDWCQGDRTDAALITAKVPDASRFGQLTFDSRSVITSFHEKNTTSRSGWINAGIYFFNSGLVRTTRMSSLERDLLPILVGTLRAWPTTGRFIDIGTPDSYASAHTFFDRAGLLILDRDGTLITEKHYLATPDDVELLPGVTEGLRSFQTRGYDLAILTNQSGIARGYFNERDLDAVNARLLELLANDGIKIRGIWHCPHKPDDNCACRKPATGMFDAVTHELGYRPDQCIVVGDKDCDVDLGRNAGARTVLVRTGYGRDTESNGRTVPDTIVDDIHELSTIEVLQ